MYEFVRNVAILLFDVWLFTTIVRDVVTTVRQWRNKKGCGQ